MTSTTRWLTVPLVLVFACTVAIPVSTFPEADIGVGEAQMTVWVADESSQRRRGLMEIDRLPSGIDGMLFVFEAEMPVSFTMLSTPMPLDIWWFDDDGRLIGSGEMEPCSNSPCTSYRSPGPIRWVLETPQGEYDFGPGIFLSTFDSS